MVPAIVRAIQVMERLSALEQGLTLSQIARALDLPKSTLHSILKTLNAEGLVVKDPVSNRYFIGVRLFEIGQGYIKHIDFLPLFREVARKIQQQRDETMLLSVRDGVMNVFIAQEESSKPLRAGPRVGQVFPCYATASGKALLAYLSHRELLNLFKGVKFTPLTKKTVSSFRQLQSMLEKVRNQGYARDYEETMEGVKCIASPIFDHSGKVTAAISMSIPASQTEEDLSNVIGLIIRGALRLSRYLGYRIPKRLNHSQEAAVMIGAGNILGGNLSEMPKSSKCLKKKRFQTNTMVSYFDKEIIWEENHPTFDEQRKLFNNQEYIFLTFLTKIPFWDDIRVALNDVARELGVKTIFTGPTEYNIKTQVEQTEELINRKVSGIIFCPIDNFAMIEPINKAISTGIPTLIAISDAPQSKRYAFIGENQYNQGLIYGQQIAKATGKKGKILVLSLPPYQCMMDRLAGLKEYLKSYTRINIIGVENAQSDLDKAAEITLKAIKANPDLRGIVCIEASAAEGAARAVEQSGKEKEIKIVGSDMDEALLNLIETEKVFSSVAQKTYLCAYYGMKFLFDITNHAAKFIEDKEGTLWRSIPEIIHTGPILITKKNVGLFQNRFNSRKEFLKPK